MRAVAGGLIDMSQADLRDRVWHLRLRWLLDEVQRQDDLQHLQFMHLRYMLGVLGPNNSATLRINGTEAFRLLEEYMRLLFGWQAADEKVRQQAEQEACRSAWENLFGSLQTQQTQQNIDAVVEWLRQQRKEA